jgi:hypothetical protein
MPNWAGPGRNFCSILFSFMFFSVFFSEIWIILNFEQLFNFEQNSEYEQILKFEQISN